MNKNARNAAMAAKRTDSEMADKVIDAKHAAMCFKTGGENGVQTGFGTNIAMNERRIILSQEMRSGA